MSSVIGEREKAKKAKLYFESVTQDTSQEKRNEIMKLYRIYNNTNKWVSPEPEPLFHQQNHKSPDRVSQFMIDYIEATHNLFQIQQKKIQQLENRVAELNAKIE